MSRRLNLSSKMVYPAFVSLSITKHKPDLKCYRLVGNYYCCTCLLILVSFPWLLYCSSMEWFSLILFPLYHWLNNLIRPISTASKKIVHLCFMLLFIQSSIVQEQDIVYCEIVSCIAIQDLFAMGLLPKLSVPWLAPPNFVFVFNHWLY